MSQQAVPASPTGWRVEYQTEGLQPGGSGGFVQGVTVGFITDSGVRGSVFVPSSQLTPDTVKAMINAKVASLVAIQNLTHLS